MKVVFLVSFMNVAGAQEAAVRVARSLRTRGYDTEIWFLYKETPYYEGFPDVRVILPCGRPGPVGYLQIAARLLRLLRRERVTVVVSFLPLANVLGQSMALLAGAKLRIASHRGPFQRISRTMQVADAICGTIGIYRRVIAVSHAVKQSFEGLPERYRCRIQVVHNGLVWTPSSLSKEQARQRFGLDGDLPIIVSVGRMKAQKNYPFQLRMFAAVPQARLVVAGDGPLRNELEALRRSLGLEDRVVFLGNVDRSNMPDLLRCADLFILPSLYEGQSNALLEALNQGLPIAASDLPEQAETLIDEEGVAAGLLLPLDDETRWSREIAALLDDKPRRQELSARAMRQARRFTLEEMTDGFERQIIDGHPESSAPLWKEMRGKAGLWPAVRCYLQNWRSTLQWDCNCSTWATDRPLQFSSDRSFRASPKRVRAEITFAGMF